MSINERLRKYQEDWFEGDFRPYVENNMELDISDPFFTGVSDEYEKADKRIMIVGQETDGWDVYPHDCQIEKSQQNVIDYLRYQLHYSNDEKLIEKFKKRNTSQFWNFFRAISKDGIVPCWNNIDKAQRNINGKTKALTVEIECELNKNLPNSNKTIFQREIEITKPDVIVLITGPNYYITMETAMNLKKNTLEDFRPSIQNSCVDISSIANFGIPTFWTYHPTYISRNKYLNRDDIIAKIMDGFQK